MLEAGLIDYWRNRQSLASRAKQCDDPLSRIKSHGPRSLKLSDIQSPLLIWGFGLLLSLVAFFFEKLVNRFQNIFSLFK